MPIILIDIILGFLQSLQGNGGIKGKVPALNWDSAVGIATSYRLAGLEVGV
jgi:hypothetical protein